MKEFKMKFLKIFAMLVAFIAGALIISQEATAQYVPVSFQRFYDELSPYGMWVDYPNYGYVWIPKGYPGFSPYATAGHWGITDDGWTWVSDYTWGWVPFHYGRWDYDKVYGWFWIPGNEWGTAWVLWKKTPGNYGWVPLRPGDSISIAFGSDFHGRDERWTFVKDRDMSKPDTIRRSMKRTKYITIISNSTMKNNTQKTDNRNATYIAVPERNEAENLQAVSAQDR
jgi:hypothetical protein